MREDMDSVRRRMHSACNLRPRPCMLGLTAVLIVREYAMNPIATAASAPRTMPPASAAEYAARAIRRTGTSAGSSANSQPAAANSIAGRTILYTETQDHLNTTDCDTKSTCTTRTGAAPPTQDHLNTTDCDTKSTCTTRTGAAPPRRLTMSRAILSVLAQYYLHADVRRAFKRGKARVEELVRGYPTADYELNYYQLKEKCITVFDFTTDWGVLGVVDSKNVEVKFLPAQHRGVLTYVETPGSALMFLKKVHRHVQSFLVPHGCVATTNSTWVAYCTTLNPPCNVGRIEIFSSVVPADEPLVRLHPVDNEEFNAKLLEDGWDWFDVKDLYAEMPNHPRPLHMTWVYDHCILHAFFETKAIEKTKYYWMKSRQAFQIMMQQVDGTFYRKFSAFPPTCGGREAKDFRVTVAKLDPEHLYKAIMSTQLYAESYVTDPDEIVLTAQKPLIPLEDWDPDEDEIDFVELFPDANTVPVYQLKSGPFE